jgi:hypothetical protein
MTRDTRQTVDRRRPGVLAAGYLIVSSTINSARYYVTVAELRDMAVAAWAAA